MSALKLDTFWLTIAVPVLNIHRRTFDVSRQFGHLVRKITDCFQNHFGVIAKQHLSIIITATQTYGLLTVIELSGRCDEDTCFRLTAL